MIYEQTLQDMDMNKTRVTKEEISISVQEKPIHFRYVKCDKRFIYFSTIKTNIYQSIKKNYQCIGEKKQFCL